MAVRNTTWPWTTKARINGNSTFEMPWDATRPIKFQVAAIRGNPVTNLVLSGNLVIENTRRVLPTQLSAVRLQVSVQGGPPQYVNVQCTAPGQSSLLGMMMVPGQSLLGGDPGRCAHKGMGLGVCILCIILPLLNSSRATSHVMGLR